MRDRPLSPLFPPRSRSIVPPSHRAPADHSTVVLSCSNGGLPVQTDASFHCGPRARHPIYWHDPCPIPGGLVERLDIILYADEREPALENGILYEKSANTDLPVPAMKPDRQFFVRSLFCIIYARPCISIRSLIQQPYGHAKCSP